jgi:hypothetical protein
MEQIEEIKCKFAFLSALFMAQCNTRRGQLKGKENMYVFMYVIFVQRRKTIFFKYGPKLKGPTRQISPWLVEVNASLQIFKFSIALFTFQMKYKILCTVKWVSDFPVPSRDVTYQNLPCRE